MLTFSCMAQIGIYNTSLTDTTLNILYNYTNTIKVYGIKNYDYLECTSNSRIWKKTNERNTFIINVIPDVKNDTIKILLNDSIIYQRGFVCFKMPYLKAILGERDDTLLTVKEIKENPQLKIILPDCYFNHSFRVVNCKVDFHLFTTKLKKRSHRIDKYYKVEYKKIQESNYEAKVLQLRDSVFLWTETGELIPKLRKNKTYRVYGDRLNYAHLTILDNMNKGDKIVFNEITVRSADGADLRLPDLIIYIE